MHLNSDTGLKQHKNLLKGCHAIARIADPKHSFTKALILRGTSRMRQETNRKA